MNKTGFLRKEKIKIFRVDATNEIKQILLDCAIEKDRLNISSLKQVVCLILPYNPFEKQIAISEYYLNSNFLYQSATTLCKELNQIDVQNNARVTNYVSYKKFLSKLGVVSIAKNTLAYSKRYGSRFVISMILLDKMCQIKNFEHIDLQGVENNICKNCNVCEKLCPTKAIRQTEFDAKRCLRSYMSSCNLSDKEVAKLMGQKVLGCEICQNCCPLNSKIKKQCCDDVDELLTSAKLILTSSINGDLKTLKELIGANVAKKCKLFELSLNAVKNANEKEFLIKLLEIKNLQEEFKNKIEQAILEID